MHKVNDFFTGYLLSEFHHSLLFLYGNMSIIISNDIIFILSCSFNQ